MFSKACEYGIRACIYIASKALDDKKVGIKEIAVQIDSPEAFTAKILQQLAKSNVILSIKGPSGGFYLLKEDLNKIMLKDIVLAIDGENIFKGCGLGMHDCSEKNPCPIHNQYKIIKNGIKEMLNTTSLFQLTHGLQNGLTFLKIDELKND